MQGATYTIQELASAMQIYHTNIESAQVFDIQAICAEVCLFKDAHISDPEYSDTLRLANDMAQQCIEATTVAMVKSRFESCYACIKAMSS